MFSNHTEVPVAKRTTTKRVGVKRKANSQNTQNDLMAWHVLVNTRTERTLQYLYRGDKGDICGKGGKGEEAAAQR